MANNLNFHDRIEKELTGIDAGETTSQIGRAKEVSDRIRNAGLETAEEEESPVYPEPEKIGDLNVNPMNLLDENLPDEITKDKKIIEEHSASENKDKAMEHYDSTISKKPTNDGTTDSK